MNLYNVKLKRHKQFLKDWNKFKLTDGQFSKFVSFAKLLSLGETLPAESRDHMLIGEYMNCREFHLGGDVLVIYLLQQDEVIFLRLGSHSQLFN